MTPDGPCWYFGSQLASEDVDFLQALTAQADHSYVPETPAQLKCLDEIIERLNVSNVTHRIEAGPYYWFPQAVSMPGPAELLDPADACRLTGELEAWRDAAAYYRPFAVSLEGAEIAAVCCSVRRRARAHIAGCETEPAYRRRGHAARAVSHWAEAVLRQNAVPFYNTSWENTASQKTAMATGAIQFAAGIAIYPVTATL
ncbi:MAG: hypothetical protein KDI36_09975 [Pseudomonadales bacterium]|nr:hypothetical protein [Pseudomonadales bacterium]